MTATTPNSATPDTINLNVTVNGKGFKNGAHAQWFVTGTTNPGGVTVNSTAFANSTTLTANITVSSTAVIGNFDVQVTNSDGRTGKGTELFAVVNSSNSKSNSCVSPVPLNPVINACTSSTAQSSCVDTAFGTNGLTMTNVPHSTNAFSWISATRQQSDGKLVAIGLAAVGSVAVARYTADGLLDTTFGNGLGYAEYVFNTTTAVYDGILDGTGNILVTGFVGPKLYVVRFTPSGTLDTSFATGGVFTFTAGGRNPQAVGNQLLVQPDGKILVAAVDTPGGAILRLNPNGSLDSGFATAGVYTNSDAFYAIAFQNVGGVSMIVGAGQNGNSFGLVRLNLNGVLDTTFGSGGQVVTGFCGPNPILRSIAVDSAGSIYAGGSTPITNNSYAVILLAKYTSVGALDTTFGDPNGLGARKGFKLVDLFGSVNGPGRTMTLSLPVDNAGNTKLLFAGQTNSASAGGLFALARFGLDGTLDSTFGTQGAAAYKFTPDDILLGGLIESNGEIVTFGTGGSGGNDMFELFRVWP